MIARMGAYPNNPQASGKHSRGFTRFRTAARAVIATRRMQFLVNKSKKAVKSTGRSSDSPTDSSTPSTARTDPASYRPTRSPAGYTSSYQPEGNYPRYRSAVSADIGRPDGLNDFARSSTHTGPILTTHQNGISDNVADRRHRERYVPRGENTSTNGVYDPHESRRNPTTVGSGGQTYSRTRPSGFTNSTERAPSPYDRSRTTYDRLEDAGQKAASPPRTHNVTADPRKTGSVSPTRSCARPTSETHRYRPPMSPPVRDRESRWRDHDHVNGHTQGLEPIPSHSSSYLRQRLPSPRRTSEDDRSPSGVSTLASSHSGSDNGDHSLSLYIHRLESLQNRLAAASKGNAT